MIFDAASEVLDNRSSSRHSGRVIRFAVLGSGSGGNSAVIECDGVRLLIDAGLSAKQLNLRLAHVGIEPGSLNGILLTHEHGDHIKGLKVFLKQNSIPVFATPATRKIVRESGIDGGIWKSFETSQTFQIRDVTIRSFAVHHDAVDPVGFVIAHDSCKLGFVSDVGHVTRSMVDCLRDLHGLFVEANYDEALLAADTKRPWPTKQRISSRHGHLSNDQVAGLLEEIAHRDLGSVVLGHLSSDCNKPDLVLEKLRTCLAGLGHSHVTVDCACQHEPTPWFVL